MSCKYYILIKINLKLFKLIDFYSINNQVDNYRYEREILKRMKIG